MRKLASVRTIAELTPIPDADNIEVARIDGWNVIVEKGLHNVGDSVVYFEIDSVLPIREEFEFLRSRCYVASPDEGFRIKTMKMRGVVSQGLVMPYDGDSPVGTDVTIPYGVVLYDPPLPVQANIKGRWPSFIAKTDQERVQNIDLIPRESYEVTVKLDGASLTAFYNRGALGVCSRNYELKPEGAYWNAASDILDALSFYGGNYAIQGELMGPGIQKNPLGLREPTVFVFDVWNINTQSYLYPDERVEFINELNEEVGGAIQQVEHFIDWEPSPTATEAAVKQNILDLTDLKIDGKIQEGLVFKSYQSTTTFKAINNRYLLKEK